MDKWGLNQSELARELGVDSSYISKILKGERTQVKDWLWERLDVIDRMGALKTQSHHPSVAARVTEDSPAYGGLTTVSIRQVPVISWCHAGEAATYEELPKSWQETVPSTCADPHAFGLVVEGDSMQPNYQSGDILIMMPSTPPRNGCLVVAKYKTDGVVFRRYHSGAEGVVRLTAYNPIYPPHDGSVDDFHWIYPVHSTLKREWR